MVGGDKASFDKAAPYLQSMARKVTYCGDLGAGLAAKIANKYGVSYFFPQRSIQTLTVPIIYSLLLGITMMGLR